MFFCYNEITQAFGEELELFQIKNILDQMKKAGVFSINFNGGEPLMREDFFEIIEYAHSLGFWLHMNTNATLIDDVCAKGISKYVKQVCTSILHSDQDIHDKMTGRKGAFSDVIKGITALVSNGVGVEVNVCTHMNNYKDIYNIAKLISDLGCRVLCSTRYILNSKENIDLLMTKEATMELVDLLFKAKSDFPKLIDVSLPGPVPFCELPESYFEKLFSLNVPCQYGYGLCRISPTGSVMPCTISDDVIADLTKCSFDEMWKSQAWDKYVNLCHLPKNCHSCSELSKCRGGCVVYDESIIACGEIVKSKKWE